MLLIEIQGGEYKFSTQYKDFDESYEAIKGNTLLKEFTSTIYSVCDRIMKMTSC